MTKRYRVILIIESSRAYGRGCLLGIASYARTHGPWSFLHIERGLTEDLPRGISKWHGDGVIARIENKTMADALRKLRLPTVDLRGRQLIDGVASLNTDPRATVRMAADHFLDRGFRNLAYCGLPGIDFSDRRSIEFTHYLSENGIVPHVFMSQQPPSRVDTVAEELRGSLDHADIVRWLRSLPKPLGVMACNDVRGRQVLDACAESRLSVPEEVAVIGVDNDEVLCDLSDPPLSSIAPDVVRIGYRGAAILEQMLHGHAAPRNTEYIAPREVVTRLSSDILAIDDPVVADAMHIIREHACGDFNVETLLDRMAVSRATLERRFARLVGRSPKHEILRVRLARVRQLLLETDYPLTTIAGNCLPCRDCS